MSSEKLRNVRVVIRGFKMCFVFTSSKELGDFSLIRVHKRLVYVIPRKLRENSCNASIVSKSEQRIPMFCSEVTLAEVSCYVALTR